MPTNYRLATATVHGTKHAELNYNNQDAALAHEFGIPKWGRNYRIGVLSDGCSGLPRYTRTEVGANLLVVFCMARIQEYLLCGAQPGEIPMPLFHAVVSFLRELSNIVMPPNISWKYPGSFRGANEFRGGINATERFKVDYLAATIIGFIDDGTQLVTFRYGDGVIVVNDEILIVDQNDRPSYAAMSVNSPAAGFEVREYKSRDVQRLLLASDGLEEVLGISELGLPGELFTCEPRNRLGPQFLLNRLLGSHPDSMEDDCTVVLRERTDEGEEVPDGDQAGAAT